MARKATIRKRCAECPKWFTPLARLASQQMVCSASCRLKRRRKQARARRALDPARYREEEVERKRLSRQRQREQRRVSGKPPDGDIGAQMASSEAPCHAPGEACNSLKSKQKFADFWDTLLDLSRAGSEREMREVAWEMWQKSRQDSAAGHAGHAPSEFSIP